jgi:hypothetical protein
MDYLNMFELLEPVPKSDQKEFLRRLDHFKYTAFKIMATRARPRWTADGCNTFYGKVYTGLCVDLCTTDNGGCKGTENCSHSNGAVLCTEKTCCPTVIIKGALNGHLNQKYFTNNKRVHDRPLYVDKSNTYGIWWDGGDGADGDWNVGSLSNLDEGKFTWGWMVNDETHDCPNNSSTWQESYNDEWSYDHSRPEPLTVKCYGMLFICFTRYKFNYV